MSIQSPTSAGSRSRGLKHRRDIAVLTAEVDRLARRIPSLVSAPLKRFQAGNDFTGMPRYVFVGPRGGGDYRRLAIFAGIHGDETAGCRTAIEFIKLLVAEPGRAAGWEIFIYPVCNPTGYEDNTRFSRRGFDLNRLFWKGAREAEVTVLEDQLATLHFDGIVSLHADDTSDGIYGFARGAIFSSDVLGPVLEAAALHLPVNPAQIIDGFEARGGIVTTCYEGVLGAPPEQFPAPFEIIFETPQLMDEEKQVAAGIAALGRLLVEYPRFIAYGQGL